MIPGRAIQSGERGLLRLEKLLEEKSYLHKGAVQ